MRRGVLAVLAPLSWLRPGREEAHGGGVRGGGEGARGGPATDAPPVVAGTSTAEILVPDLAKYVTQGCFQLVEDRNGMHLGRLPPIPCSRI